ncbi:A24 family peptidase [Methylocapsa polymorpha]|uniref:A24 family peptidase n=1 Tax=Methylocapsa polymorpha TaxID=3080828 RepID=A0ABZ0HUC6_9HYPH|nr:A24 family peptidase [Methylocapsa sp. RX1]
MPRLRDCAEFDRLLPAEIASPGDEIHSASGGSTMASTARRKLLICAAVVIIAGGAALLSIVAAPGLAGLLGAALALLMIAIAIVDARSFIIPDQLSLAAFLLALANASQISFEGAPERIIIAASQGVVLSLAFFGLREIYRRVRKRQGIGLGDVKLAAVAGAWLEWTFVPVAIEIAALAALAAYALGGLLAHRPLRAGARLPFGLFFAPAIWLCWLLEAAFYEY